MNMAQTTQNNTANQNEPVVGSDIFLDYTNVVNATDAYNQLPFENVQDEQVAKNVAYLATFFACDFRQMALHALQHEINVQFTKPLEDKAALHTLLQLVEEECATDNIEPGNGLRSHLDFMCDAAEAAGVDVSGVKLMYQTNGQDLSGLAPDLQELVVAQRTSYADPGSCLTTLAMRESLPGNSSRRIIDNLPEDTKFDKYRHFLAVHIDVDGGDDGHGEMISAMLPKQVANLDHAMQAAAGFQERRNTIYQKALQIS